VSTIEPKYQRGDKVRLVTGGPSMAISAVHKERDLQQRYGDDFVYENAAGNLAISRKVLSEFRRLNKDCVVWERGERCWRPRETTDAVGRMQD